MDYIPAGLTVILVSAKFGTGCGSKIDLLPAGSGPQLTRDTVLHFDGGVARCWLRSNCVRATTATFQLEALIPTLIYISVQLRQVPKLLLRRHREEEWVGAWFNLPGHFLSRRVRELAVVSSTRFRN